MVSGDTNHMSLVSLEPKLGVAGPEVKSRQYRDWPCIALEMSHKHCQSLEGLLATCD